MKRIVYFLAVTFCVISCNDKDNLWYTPVNELDSRVSSLEQKVDQLNTNIEALQTVVQAQTTGDYITSVTEIKSGNNVIGYTITFKTNSPITIYNGSDGRDGRDGVDGRDGRDGTDGVNGTNGTNGTNGQDGHTPVIGVAQFIDGIYYWTVDGAWLLDGSGNKLRVTGEKGADGTNGTNGTNGTDGITPQLKIENDYWYVSYNEGATWTQLGKAKGDKGEDGTNGQDGDGMFQYVTQDENFVYFTLANGSVITLAKSTGETIAIDTVKVVNGAIQAAFSVSPTQKVYFSMGSLQFNAAQGSHLCADGTAKPGTWRFAEHQYDYTGKEKNALASAIYNGWIDNFAWATSGWNNTSNDPSAVNYEPWTISASGVGFGPSSTMTDVNLIGTSAYYDWGIYNAISNGGNQPNQWRLPSAEEWRYLTQEREHAEYLRSSATIVLDKYTYIQGYIILPDSISFPNTISYYPQSTNFEANVFSITQWETMEVLGVIFLPRALAGSIWLSSADTGYKAYVGHWNTNQYVISTGRYSRSGVRLVKDVE